jgi:hypothetical protein
MTLPPEKIGDKGQRYVVQRTTVDDPDTWVNLVYSNDLASAKRAQLSAGTMPSTRLTRTCDRERTPHVGDLDAGTPNRFDHSKRGFQP